MGRSSGRGPPLSGSGADRPRAPSRTREAAALSALPDRRTEQEWKGHAPSLPAPRSSVRARLADRPSRGPQGSQRAWSDHAVDHECRLSLEAAHSRVRCGSEEAIHRAGAVAKPVESPLNVTDPIGAIRAPEAAASGEQPLLLPDTGTKLSQRPRADRAVDRESAVSLEAAHSRVRPRPEQAVHRARAVAEPVDLALNLSHAPGGFRAVKAGAERDRPGGPSGRQVGASRTSLRAGRRRLGRGGRGHEQCEKHRQAPGSRAPCFARPYLQFHDSPFEKSSGRMCRRTHASGSQLSPRRG